MNPSERPSLVSSYLILVIRVYPSLESSLKCAVVETGYIVFPQQVESPLETARSLIILV